MKVIVKDNYSYKRIEFCCNEMGDLLMDGFVQSYPHSDHHPVFYLTITRNKLSELRDLILHHCPCCGAKIEGSYETD